MSAHAVVAVWRMDPAKAEEQEAGLNERIIPSVSGWAGFVRGRWTRAADGVRHVAFIEFDSQTAARDFATMVGGQDDGSRAAAGIVNESIDVLEVIGSA